VLVTENTLAGGVAINYFVESVVRCAARNDTSYTRRSFEFPVTFVGFPDAWIGGLVKPPRGEHAPALAKENTHARGRSQRVQLDEHSERAAM
jgi:hypothetical protein